MHHHSDHPLPALTGQIYAAVLDDADWAGASAAIASSFHANSALLSGGAAPTTEQIFYWQREHWERNHCGGAQACPDLCAAWCGQAEVHYVLGASFRISAQESGLLQLRRTQAGGPYRDADHARLQALLPHVQRAMQLRQRLSRAQWLSHASTATLAQLAMAAFLVDAELQVLHATPAAWAMLDRADLFRLVDGRLQAVSALHRANLARLVRTITSAPATPVTHWMRLERHGARTPWTLVVTLLPSPPAPLVAQPAALILLRDPEQSRAPLPALQQLFDLTPAEAGVAQALADGGTLESVTLRLQISTNTVKTHLHRIFEKTATHCQGELIALIHGSIASGVHSASDLNNIRIIHLNDVFTASTAYTEPTE